MAELITQPLLLYIVASLDNGIEGVSDRSDIYDKLFTQIIDRKYSKDGQIEPLNNVTKPQLRSLLQEIAFQVFKTGKGFVTTIELLTNPEVIDFTENIASKNISNTLKGVLISFYFQEVNGEKQDEGGIEFIHKSLQEYLTAEKIVETLFIKVLDKNSQGKYILKGEIDFLKIINELFGHQMLTNEIRNYISGLLSKKSLPLKTELETRLNLHIEFYFKKNFLISLNEYELNPIGKIANTFIGYWFFIQSLELKKSFIETNEIVKQFLELARLTREHAGDLSISYQNFPGGYFNRIQFMYEKLRKARFTNCDINYCIFYNSDMEMLFQDCEIQNCVFTMLTGNVLIFRNCFIEFSRFNIYGLVKTLTFKDCRLNIGEFLVHKENKGLTIKFENVTFDEDNIKAIRNLGTYAKLKNCNVGVVMDNHNNYPSYTGYRQWDYEEYIKAHNL